MNLQLTLSLSYCVPFCSYICIESNIYFFVFFSLFSSSPRTHLVHLVLSWFNIRYFCIHLESSRLPFFIGSKNKTCFHLSCFQTWLKRTEMTQNKNIRKIKGQKSPSTDGWKIFHPLRRRLCMPPQEPLPRSKWSEWSFESVRVVLQMLQLILNRLVCITPTSGAYSFLHIIVYNRNNNSSRELYAM